MQAPSLLLYGERVAAKALAVAGKEDPPKEREA